MSDTKISGATPSTVTHEEAEAMTCTQKQFDTQRNEVSYAKQNEGCLGRGTVEAGIKALHPHQSYEVALKAGGTVGGGAVKGDAKLSVTRRDDGKFEVSVANSTVAGIDFKDAKLMGGLGAAAKYVAHTPEAAADIAQALATVELSYAASVGVPLGGPLMMLGASDAMRRLEHYQANMSEVKVDARSVAEVDFHANTPGLDLALDAGGKVEGCVTINLEKGTVTLSGELEGKADGSAQLDFGKGPIAKQVGHHFGGKAELKLTARVESRFQIPTEIQGRIRRGELGGIELVKTLQTMGQGAKQTVVIEAELEGKLSPMIATMGRAKLTAEVPLSANVAEALLTTEWKVEGEAGAGIDQKLKVGPLGFEASALTWTGWHSKPATLGDALSAVKTEFSKQAALDASLENARMRAAVRD